MKASGERRAVSGERWGCGGKGGKEREEEEEGGRGGKGGRGGSFLRASCGRREGARSIEGSGPRAEMMVSRSGSQSQAGSSIKPVTHPAEANGAKLGPSQSRFRRLQPAHCL